MDSSHNLNALGFRLGYNILNGKIKLELIPDPDMSIFFEKVEQLEFIIFLIDIAKPTSYDPKWIDPKKFDFNKFTRNSSK